MNAEDIRSAVMATISSTWGTKTLIDFPNLPFTAPSNASWIRPRLKFGNSFVGELGGDGLGLRTGVLMISIFVPPGSGTKIAGDYSKILENLFRRADINGVMFDEPDTDDAGVDEGNGFYHFVTSCPFNTWIGE